jgi:hypothetical protein
MPIVMWSFSELSDRKRYVPSRIACTREYTVHTVSDSFESKILEKLWLDFIWLEYLRERSVVLTYVAGKASHCQGYVLTVLGLG